MQNALARVDGLCEMQVDVGHRSCAGWFFCCWHGLRLVSVNPEQQVSTMRIVISTLGGIVVALICTVVMAAATSLGPLQLSACSIAIASLVGYVGHGLPATRRACMRVRMLLGRLQMHHRSGEWPPLRALAASMLSTRRAREGRALAARGAHRLQAAAVQGKAEDDSSPSRVPESQPVTASLRARLERTNPVWISYALLALWACYEVVGVTHVGDAPIETASVGVSSRAGFDEGFDMGFDPGSAIGEELARISALVDGGVSASVPLDGDAAFATRDPDSAMPALLAAGTAAAANLVHAGVATKPPAAARKRVRRDPCHGHIGRCNSVLEQFLARGTKNEF